MPTVKYTSSPVVNLNLGEPSHPRPTGVSVTAMDCSKLLGRKGSEDQEDANSSAVASALAWLTLPRHRHLCAMLVWLCQLQAPPKYDNITSLHEVRGLVLVVLLGARWYLGAWNCCGRRVPAIYFLSESQANLFIQ